MITLTPGRTLTSGDLYLVTRDATGNPVTPYSIVYAIYQTLDGAQALVTNPGMTPANSSPGCYNVNMVIPTTWSGVYQLIWTVQETPTSAPTNITEDFTIQAVKPGYNLQAPSVLLATTQVTKPQYADIVMAVRELLSDTNPDRNYHFRPPTAAKVVANYSARVGFIWEDPTILIFLKAALGIINSANPKNFYGFTLDNITTDQGAPYAACAALGAAWLCLSAEGCRWTADEFGYSLNGVSLDLQKGQNYISLANNYKTAFDAMVVPLTANRPRSMGVRQNRWMR